MRTILPLVRRASDSRGRRGPPPCGLAARTDLVTTWAPGRLSVLHSFVPLTGHRAPWGWGRVCLAQCSVSLALHTVPEPRPVSTQHLLGQPVLGDQRPAGEGQAELSSSPPPSSVPLSLCFQRMGLSQRDPGSKQLFTEGVRCPAKGLGAARAAGPRGALTCGRGSSLQRLLPLLLVLLLHHLSGKQQQSKPDAPEPRTMWLCVRSAGCRVGCRWHSREPLHARGWGPWP